MCLSAEDARKATSRPAGCPTSPLQTTDRTQTAKSRTTYFGDFNCNLDIVDYLFDLHGAIDLWE